MIVTPSPEWERKAVEWATLMCNECVGHDRLQADGRPVSPEQRLQQNIMSTRAEIAVAKVVRAPWRRSRDPNTPDVGGCIEVRARSIPGTGGDLALRPGDDKKIERPFVLVHVYELDQRIDVVGWLFGYEARERGGPERFTTVYVPPPYRPIEELIEWYNTQYLVGIVFRLPAPASFK